MTPEAPDRMSLVVFSGTADKLTAVASVGRDLENLEAEVALERGDEFRAR